VEKQYYFCYRELKMFKNIFFALVFDGGTALHHHTSALWTSKPLSLQLWGERTFPVLEHLMNKNIPKVLKRCKPAFEPQRICKKKTQTQKTSKQQERIIS